MANKVDELLSAAKLNELFHKKQLEEKNKNTIMIVLAIVGAIAAVAGIAYAVYKHMAPDYMDDLDADDIYDNIEDDYVEFSDCTPEAED